MRHQRFLATCFVARVRFLTTSLVVSMVIVAGGCSGSKETPPSPITQEQLNESQKAQNEEFQKVVDSKLLSREGKAQVALKKVEILLAERKKVEENLRKLELLDAKLKSGKPDEVAAAAKSWVTDRLAETRALIIKTDEELARKTSCD